jgi:HK97 family phage major capsid protein
MINTVELRQKADTLVVKARQIHDKGELTAEEQQEFDSLMAEADKLAKTIADEERLQTHELAHAEKVEDGDKRSQDGEFRSLAEFIATIRFNPNDPRLTERRTEETPLAQMGEKVQGGYLVPDRFLPDILQISPEDAMIRPRATVIPAGYPPDATIYLPVLDQVTYGVYGGVAVEWITEGGEKPASKPKFDQIPLSPYEVAGTVNITDKLLRNYTAFDGFIRGLLRNAVIAAEEVAFLSGAGTTQPTGLIGHASNVLIARAAAGTIGYTDVSNMYASQLVGGRYVWIASQTALPALMSMEDTGGHLIWQPNARDGAPGTLLGLPCLITGRTPTLGNQGDLILADLKYYLVKDGSGIFVDASPHFRFTENITVIKITWNVDGKPWPSGPFTLEDGETEVSPFVVLDEAEGS